MKGSLGLSGGLLRPARRGRAVNDPGLGTTLLIEIGFESDSIEFKPSKMPVAEVAEKAPYTISMVVMIYNSCNPQRSMTDSTTPILRPKHLCKGF